ncbi:MAG: L-fucose:H+ symporter permease [Cytophagaceae bacterium]
MAGISQSGNSGVNLLDPNKNYTTPLAIVTALFFMWGFITCMNDILIPHLKDVFNLSYAEAMLIQFTFFGAYFIMSLPSGKIVSKIGYKNGIIVGLITAGIGCLLFYPAAETKLYGFFLAALFILASGITLLQVAANPYVAILGKPETSSSRLNLTQAFNSLGTTVAPALGAILIFTGATLTATELVSMTPEQLLEYKLTKADAVKLPYLGLAALLFIIAAVIKISKLPKIEMGNTEESSGSFKGALSHKHLVLGVICIFMYVGGEVAIGSFLINFLKYPDVAGLTEEEASTYLSMFWGGAMIGRFVGAAALSKVDPGKALGLCSVIVVALLSIVITASGDLAKWAIVTIGLFNSIMFPTIFTLAIRNLGKNTSQGSSLLIMAVVGGAIVPLVQGALADLPSIGLRLAFIIPALCYIYIVFYGFIGSKPVANPTEEESKPELQEA